MTNLEIIQDGYEKFAVQDIEGVLAKFDERIKWHDCNGFPSVEGDSIFIGPESILKNVFAMIPEYFDGFNINIAEFISNGNKVVMQGFKKEQGKKPAKSSRQMPHTFGLWKMGKLPTSFKLWIRLQSLTKKYQPI